MFFNSAVDVFSSCTEVVLWAAQRSLHPHSEGEQSIFFSCPTTH
jgi:hypothetical protein